MKLIAAADKNWAIGYKNDLLVSIPEDMKFFRETTKGHVVVMGRRTLESFPGGRPLKNRVNIVLTSDLSYEKEGARIVHDIPELQRELEAYANEEIFVIGGGSVYKQLLPLCDTAYITRIDKAFPADTYFPNLDEEPDWKVTQQSEEYTHEDLRYHFLTYERAGK